VLTNEEQNELIRRAAHLVAHFADDHTAYQAFRIVGDLRIEWDRIDARSWAVEVYYGSQEVVLFWHPSNQGQWWDGNQRKTLEILREAMVLDDLAEV
jgi:hypothetical protein